MNVPATASKIIDKAILLKKGGVIVIPCSSYEEMERLRIRLYKLKKQLGGNYREVALSLDISRKIGTDKWTLFITKDTILPGVLVIENGEIRPFEEEEEGEEEDVRRTRLMAKDAKDAENTKEKERDFGEVAAEIEAAQNLTVED